jgi:glycosyltransferase involved in cell wall biosynthesis
MRSTQLRRGVRSLLRHPTRVAEPDPEVAPAGLVVCSLEPWDDVWRRNQFFVREMTDADPSLRVLYVEPPVDLLHELVSGRRPPLAQTRRLRPVAGRPQVIRFQPVKLLPRVLGGWTDASLARQVVRAAAQAELVDPDLWINDLDYAQLAGSVTWPVVYDVTDDWLLASVPRRIARARRRRELRLLDAADEVVVCSPGLENTKGALRGAVHLITNAVDLDRFRAPSPRPDDLPEPPVVVYAGTLHEDRLDVDLVVASAKALPRVQFAFVGPDALSSPNRSRLESLANVHLLGARPYDDIAAYLQHASALVVPHVVTPFTESLDPIKAYECLAVGVRTLATPVAGFRDLDGPVWIATEEEFPDQLRKLLSEPAPGSTPVTPPTWTAQAAAFRRVIERARDRRRTATTRVVYLGHVARKSGGEVALARALSPLVAAGVEAHVVLGEHGPIEGDLRAAGATVEVLPIDPALRDARRDSLLRSATHNVTSTVRHITQLRRRLLQITPHVVHTNTLKAAIYGGLAARSAGIPVVWHVRDRVADDYLPGPTVHVVRALSRMLPTRVIANSHATASALGRGTVIHDGYRRSRSSPERRGPVRRVAIVGRLSPWKGQHVVLPAFAEAFTDDDVRCAIAGSALFGEERYAASLHALANDLGIADRVDFLGHVDDVESLLDEIDVMVHASTVPEPFGQVIVEAMAAGVPIIASDAGGVREIVEPEVHALLTPPGDVAALSTALRRLRDDDELRVRLATAGRRRAQDFLPETSVAAYLAEYAAARNRR